MENTNPTTPIERVSMASFPPVYNDTPDGPRLDLDALGMDFMDALVHPDSLLAQLLAEAKRLSRENVELRDALGAAFFALGRAGGNTLASPHRAAWEAARAALHQGGR